MLPPAPLHPTKILRLFAGTLFWVYDVREIMRVSRDTEFVENFGSGCNLFCAFMIALFFRFPETLS